MNEQQYTEYLNNTTRVSLSDVHVDTNDFRASHGKEPRGAGGWAFTFGERFGRYEFAPRCETYGEAKRWAIRRGADLGVTTVYLCS